MSGFIEEFMHSGSVTTGSFCARRDFLKMLLAAPLVMRRSWFALLRVRIGILSDDANHDALRGARMSVQESQRAATLLNADLIVSERAAEDGPQITAWLNGLAAVVLACTPEMVGRLLSQLDAANVVVVNCAAPPDAVPGLCKAGVRSVWPATRSSGNAVVWDASLEKFGAEQLNARYRSMYRARMTPLAWSGWFAVKLLWESAARAGSGDARALDTFLSSPRAVFDGHKGQMLRFGKDGVLRQPLYRISRKNGRKQVVELEPSQVALPCT